MKYKKLPYSIDAAHANFDITKPQPQLYVTPNFAYLNLVLEEFANKMALRTGLIGNRKTNHFGCVRNN
jgi:phenylalanine-4-hydroxylase